MNQAFGTVYENFYRVPRLGGKRLKGVTPLSDGGGPFGFDIRAALAFHYLVVKYQPDVIIETGSHVGDTTEYLARTYPWIPVHSCDVDESHVRLAQARTRRLSNAFVVNEDSRKLLARVLSAHQRPLVFLDAHWGPDWPLKEELALIDNGIVCVDDFDIGVDGYGFDEYDGVRCGPDLIFGSTEVSRVYLGSTAHVYEFPCLQNGRLAGRGYFAKGMPDYMMDSRMFVPLER